MNGCKGLTNTIFIGVTAALVTTSAPTALSAHPNHGPIVRPPQLPETGPVRCGIFQRHSQFDRSNRFVGSRGVNRRASPSIVPPPPRAAPPPPPPPTIAAEAAPSSVVVTGTRQRGSSTKPSTRHPVPRPIVGPFPLPSNNSERYDGKEVASIKRVSEAPVSTFAVDVDTGSYSNVRRILNEGRLPQAAAVRTEEMINYFRYDYPLPTSREAPFSVNTDLAQTPWNKESKLLRIGLRGYDIARDQRPRANLVFLVDVSGSMGGRNKLDLVKSTLKLTADQLRKDDRVSIVVYSGRTGVLLEPTSNKDHIKQAIDCMYASGSTAGGAALKLAYSTARAHYLKNGINRIILTTDGDFNVGTSDVKELKEIVARERKSGVSLTALGFGTGNIKEDIMEGIANVGNGNYAYIDSANEARKVLSDELSSTLFTIAEDVKIQVEFNPDNVKEYRLIGYENRLLAEEDFDNDTVDAGDIGAGHQVTALYEVIPANAKGWFPKRRYSGNKSATSALKLDAEMAQIRLRYKLPKGKKSRLIKREIPATLLARASAPKGDMAHAIAVAAFGQKLRADKYLGDYSFADIGKLSGSSSSFWRQEFKRLTTLADVQ